ncbi:hypothetical protein, partial [Cupriavidus taiwanensis]|uniref:hypothetical protein n=1 Tax=Cupriavidus taiwanensis TaxID=164546 RepID=UPI0039C12BF2
MDVVENKFGVLVLWCVPRFGEEDEWCLSHLPDQRKPALPGGASPGKLVAISPPDHWEWPERVQDGVPARDSGGDRQSLGAADTHR